MDKEERVRKFLFIPIIIMTGVWEKQDMTKILLDREKACDSQFRRYFMFLLYSGEQNDETMNATREDKL